VHLCVTSTCALCVRASSQMLTTHEGRGTHVCVCVCLCVRASSQMLTTHEGRGTHVLYGKKDTRLARPSPFLCEIMDATVRPFFFPKGSLYQGNPSSCEALQNSQASSSHNFFFGIRKEGGRHTLCATEARCASLSLSLSLSLSDSDSVSHRFLYEK